jgi:hypothetical protein
MSTEAKLRSPQEMRREGYERSDADVRSLLKFGASLLTILIIVLISMKSMFFYFARSQKLGPPASPFEEVRVLPPQPRLQVQPRIDLQTYCEDQLEQLNTYGWVDPHNEVVRIPVDRAMDLIVQRGLPARPAASATTGAEPGRTAAGEASGAVSMSQTSDLQGPCGYLMKPAAAVEEKK